MATNVNKTTTPKESKSLVGAILFKYLPYWPLFVFFVIVTLFAAWFYLRTTAPQYEVHASIMLKEEKENREDVINSLDQLAVRKVVDNEIEVLRSNSLMNDVVRNLHLYAAYYEENDLVPKSAYTSSPVTIEAAFPEKLLKAPKVPFQFDQKDSLVVIGTNKYPINKLVSTPYGDLRFVPNPHQSALPTKPLYFTIGSLREVATDLQAALRTVATSKQTTVISLKMKDTDPKRGEDILNELIAVYNKATYNDKSRLAASALDFVNKQLVLVEQDLLEIEKKAQTYKSSRNAVDISTQGQLFLKNITDNDQKMADVNMQLSVLDGVEKYVKSKDGKEGVVPSTLGLSDPTMGDLVNKLYEEELSYKKLEKTTGENNPTLVAIKDRINKMKPSLMENIQSQRSSLEASRDNLSSTNSNYSALLHSIPQKERELIDISRQQSIKSNLYSFLLQKKAETEMSFASNLSDIRVVDRAQSTANPVSPKGKLIYIVAFVFSLLLPVLFVSAKEMLNRKILFRHEIEALTNVPIIGEISLDKTKESMVIQKGKRTFIAEQFRRLRTSIGYVGGASGKKKILITSSLSGEGKSFVAANLSLSIALTNKKVVLLELDLANPSLSRTLNVNFETGVSNYLWGECEPEDIIKRLPFSDNLFFVPCGPLPENPSELLLSERLKTLLDYLSEAFDTVIIDSAPCGLLSDAYVLSPMCNTTLYVVKHKFTPKLFMERLDEENQANQLKNVGIIFNGIRSRGFTKNGYGYGYGYGYIHNKETGKKRKKKITGKQDVTTSTLT